MSLGKETLTKEYKLFTLKIDEELTEKEIYFYLETGKWLSNEKVMMTLKYYFVKYLPKYISSFSNLPSKRGFFYIGVSDKGIIKGIPFKGNLDKNMLKDFLLKVCKQELYFSSSSSKKYFINNINLKLINCTPTKIENVDKNWYEKDLSSYNQKKCIEENYKNYKKKISNILASQKKKLSEMILKDRYNFYKFLKCKNVLNRKKYKHNYSKFEYLDLANVPTYNELLIDIKNKNFSHYCGEEIFLFENFSKEIIPNYSHKIINDIMIMYMFGRYKDFCCLSILSTKLDKPKINSGGVYPKFLLTNVEKMFPLWKKNNRNMKLYYIEIEIKTTDTINYFDYKRKKITNCKREMIYGEPSTVYY